MATAVYSTKDELITAILAELGSQQSYASISAGTGALKDKINAGWDVCMREIQSRMQPRCCIARANLNAFGTAPLFGYDRQFLLPVDCLIWLPPSREDADWFMGELEGRYIQTNADAPLPIRYIRLVDNVSLWSAGLGAAMRYAVGQLIAMALTEGIGRKQNMEDLLSEAVAIGKRIDGQQTGRRTLATPGSRSAWVSGMRRPYSYRGR